MRLFSLVLAASLFAVPAFAQKVSPMTGTTTAAPKLTTPAPEAAPAAPAVSPKPARKPHRARRTMQERFDAANTSHDGKLTLAQAKAAKWTRVATHFVAIDTANHGYVTIDDIHAYNRAQRAAHKAAKKAAGQTKASTTK